MGISSSGIGSNIDVDGIVKQLMKVESKPLDIIASKQASYNAKLSGFGTLKSAISSFQNAMRGLVDPAKFQAMRVTSADATIASASAASAANATPGNYTLEVTKLAQAQKMVAAGVADSKAAIGDKNTSNTITFDFGTIAGGSFNATTGKYTGASFTSSGGGVKTITINSTNNSLEGIRDAINGAGMGVTATVVNDGSGTPYRLALTVNATGKTNSLKISVAGDPAMAALLNHDPADNAGQGFTETATAQNAEFKVDGIAISKTTNNVTDAIAGVNLNLAKTGGPTTVSVTRDTTGVTSAVSSFVTAYNNIAQTLRDAGAYDPTTKKAAILNGESTLRNIQVQVRSILNSPVAGGTSAFTLLSQVGVSMEKDGLLTLDSAKLQKAMDTNFSGIAGLFSNVGKTSDSLVGYVNQSAKTKSGVYGVNISQLARQASATAVGPAHVPGKGSILGSAAAGLTISGSNDTLDVVIDGVAKTVAIPQATYATAGDLASAVQASIDGAYGTPSKATVTQSGGALKIESNTGGTSSAVDITGGNGKSNLLGSAPTVTAGSQTSIASGANTLDVTIDGTTATITLDPGNYSYASLAAAIQTKINGNTAFTGAGSTVAVTESGGVFTVTSNLYGSASAVAINGGTAKASLFGTPSVTAGLDVAGTINGVSATGVGQVLTGAAGNDADGLTLKITGGTTGDRGTVTFSQGYAYQFQKLTASLLDSQGALQARTDGINAAIKQLQKDNDKLEDRLALTEKRYRAQFTALDTLIASMNQTSSYLTQQLASLSKNSS